MRLCSVSRKARTLARASSNTSVPRRKRAVRACTFSVARVASALAVNTVSVSSPWRLALAAVSVTRLRTMAASRAMCTLILRISARVSRRRPMKRL